MSGEKRAAGESFGSTQLVKRQRSEADTNGGALVKANGGALIQGVSLHTAASLCLYLGAKTTYEGTDH